MAARASTRCRSPRPPPCSSTSTASRYEPVAIRIEKDGRWSLPDRPPTALAASEVIEQGRLASAHRSGRARRRTWSPTRPKTPSCIDRRAPQARRRERPGHRPRPRRRLSRAARPVRRGRHRPGTARAGERAVRRRRRARLGGGDGQGVHEGRLRRPRRCRLPSTARCSSATGRRIGTPRWRRIEALGYPVFVKPANLGSSVGISKAKTRAGPRDGRRSGVRVRPQGRGRSRRAGGAGARSAASSATTPPKRRSPARSSRAASSTTTRRNTSTAAPRTRVPADLDAAMQAEVKRLAIEAFKAIDCSGMARVDFLLSTETGRLYVNEINTIPGFTTISMYSQLWAASGVDYPALLDRLIKLAIERHAEKQRLKTSAVVTPRGLARRLTLVVACLMLAGLELRSQRASAGQTGLTGIATLAADLRSDPRRAARSGRSGAEDARATRRPSAPATSCWPRRSWWRILLDPNDTSHDREFTTRVDAAIEECTRWTDGEPQRAEAWFYLGAAYGARVSFRVQRGERLAGGPRRQAHQGVPRARALARPAAGRRAIRRRTLQVLRGHRAGGGEIAALPADAARRRSGRRPEGHGGRARARRAAARRGRLPAPLDLPVVREPAEARPRAARRACGTGIPATRTWRCAPARSRISYFHDAGASLGVWQALADGAARTGDPVLSEAAGPDGRGGAVERARGDRSRRRRAGQGDRDGAGPAVRRKSRAPGGCVARCWIGWDSGRPPWTPTRPPSPTSLPAIRTASPTRRAPAFAPHPTRRRERRIAPACRLARLRAGSLDEADASLAKAASRAPRDQLIRVRPRACPPGDERRRRRRSRPTTRSSRRGRTPRRSRSRRPTRGAPRRSKHVAISQGARARYRSATHVFAGDSRLAAEVPRALDRLGAKYRISSSRSDRSTHVETDTSRIRTREWMRRVVDGHERSSTRDRCDLVSSLDTARKFVLDIRFFSSIIYILYEGGSLRPPVVTHWLLRPE